MQQHQQWIQNRSYLQHLKSLKRIKARRNMSCASWFKREDKNQNKKQFKIDFKKQNILFIKNKNKTLNNSISHSIQPLLLKQSTNIINNTNNDINNTNSDINNTNRDINNTNSDINNTNSDINNIKQQIHLNISKSQRITQPFNPVQFHRDQNRKSSTQKLKFLSSRIYGKQLNNRLQQLQSQCEQQKQNYIQQQLTKSHIAFLMSRKSNDPKKLFTLKQQQLIWQNYLLGKRLIQTGPVICKKKLDQEYKKHKQLVKINTLNKVHNKPNANYRLKKLQQYKDSIVKLSDDHRLQHNSQLNKYIINLNIQNIEIFKYKMQSFEDIVVAMRYGKKNIQQIQINDINQINKPSFKSNQQASQCIPSGLLTSYHFYFTFKKTKFQANLPIFIQIKNIKSLNILTIGTFCFQFNHQKSIKGQNAILYNAGKPIGQVKFNVEFGKKSQFKSNNEQ